MLWPDVEDSFSSLPDDTELRNDPWLDSLSERICEFPIRCTALDSSLLVLSFLSMWAMFVV